jgi:hypothetical protein
VQQDASPSVPKPRICLWCSSTNTFAAQRCLFCGMDLGQELQRARAQQPIAHQASGMQAHRRSGFGRALFMLPLALILGFVILHLAGIIS